MKKLIVLIGITLLTVNIFAQHWWILNKNSEYSYGGGIPYTFTVDGEKYTLSYDSLQNDRTFDAKGRLNPDYEKEIANRPVYIFRFDGTKWIKATDVPIQYDYYIGTINGGKYCRYVSNTPDAYNYKAENDGLGSRVTFLNNGEIMIDVVNEYSNGVDRKRHVYIQKILLTPIGNKIYKPTNYGKSQNIY